MYPHCQFEINFTYADALTTADRHTFFKWMVKTVAEQHGLLATFMPKPFAHLTGNGAHFHMSLWDAEKDVNLFDDRQDELGLSQTDETRQSPGRGHQSAGELV